MPITPSASIYVYSLTSDIIAELQNDSEKSTTSASYVMVKETKISAMPPMVTVPHTVRVYFEMRTGSATYTAYGTIYKNGVAIGTQRTNSTTSYVAYTEDISNVAINLNDLLQVYGHGYASGYQCYIRNFRALGLLTAFPTAQKFGGVLDA